MTSSLYEVGEILQLALCGAFTTPASEWSWPSYPSRSPFDARLRFLQRWSQGISISKVLQPGVVMMNRQFTPVGTLAKFRL
jgi:hypothetical protein